MNPLYSASGTPKYEYICGPLVKRIANVLLGTSYPIAAIALDRTDIISIRAPFLSISDCGKSDCTHFGEPSPLSRDPDKPGETRIPIGPTDCISMHRHARLNPAHRLPHDHGIHARDVFISGRLKRLIRQAHGLIEKLLVVHDWIVAGLRAAEHSYFPMGFDNSIVRNAAFRRIPFILNTAE